MYDKTYKKVINEPCYLLAVPSISSAPTTPCHGVFDKSPSFDYASFAFDYSYDYGTASKALSGSSGSSQAFNNQGQSFDLVDKEALEDKEVRSHDENKEEDNVAQTENDKQDWKPEADKAAYSVKQKLVQKLSFNLREGSDNEGERKERKTPIKSGRPPLPER